MARYTFKLYAEMVLLGVFPADEGKVRPPRRQAALIPLETCSKRVLYLSLLAS
jgi:hypothetical protein